MKILIVNTTDINGGAARAAFRLHKALLVQGIKSKMLVQSKSLEDFTVMGPQTKFQKILGKIRPTLDSIPVQRYSARTKTLFSPSWLPFSGIVEKINSLNPDVVNLQWIQNGMLKIDDIQKINAPIVWTLQDMWAFTGGCHYVENCDGYKRKCGNCFVLGSNHEIDLSRKIWIEKNEIFSRKKNITIVCVSDWLLKCAKESSLFRNFNIIKFPNLLDTKIFAPFDKFEARKLFNLPQYKKLVLFGAIGATRDPRKGFKELTQALDYLPIDYELVVFGASEPQIPQGFKQKAHYLGHLHDDVSLRVLYSAADVMVVPSLQEAFGQTASESMACGTPVVAFGSTGLLDIIEHQETGYLAKPFETKDLANGINWVIQHNHPAQLAKAARDKVMREFDSQVVARNYIELYEEIMKRKL